MRCKRVVSLLMTLVMVLSMFSSITVLADSEIKVILNGEEMFFDVPPQLIDNRTMVPMRKIFEAMGTSVDWDATTQTITAKKDDITIVMQIDNNVIIVNDEKITLDVPPQLVDSRTLVPARAVAESLKAKVEWDEATQSVIITNDADVSTDIKPIDLNKQTDFVCNVGATISYGFNDIWSKTVGTDFIPYITMVNSAYRGQVVLISPLYANFTIDDKGYAKVTYSIKRKKPDGKEDVLLNDVVAIDGKTMPNQIIKAMGHIEYMIDDNDPLGLYTFTVESKDIIGNKTTTNVFTVNYTDYEYKKNEFNSTQELNEFVFNYARNPNPDRIIDSIIYAEKNDLITYPIFFAGFVEMLAKNPYLGQAAITEFEREFGAGGTDTLILLENTAAEYSKTIFSSNPPTMTKVAVTDDIDKDIMLYGSAMGSYLTGASYDAVKVLISSLADGEFKPSVMQEYGVPSIKEMVSIDPLFKAYCEYMMNYEDGIDVKVKNKLSEILK